MPRCVAAASLALVLAACSSPATSTPVGATAARSDAPPTTRPAAPSLDIQQPGRTASTGQTDTDWGPIWNEVPPGFPEPPGGERAEAENGPASAAWTVPAAALPFPIDVARFYVDRFSAAGYGGGQAGPLEDGSASAWASNGYGCDILVTIVPRGAVALATVLYGAGCPFKWPVEG